MIIRKLTPKEKKAQKEFLREALAERQEDFLRLLDECKIQDPRFFLKIYTELSKTIMPKETKLDVTVGINRDFDELKAMSSMTLISPEQQLPSLSTFVQMEQFPDMSKDVVELSDED